MTTTYRKLPGLVEAKQVPNTNDIATQAELIEVAQWAGGKLNMYLGEDKLPATLIRIPTLDGPLLAFASDYIVKDGETVTVEGAELFAATYVAAE